MKRRSGTTPCDLLAGLHALIKPKALKSPKKHHDEGLLRDFFPPILLFTPQQPAFSDGALQDASNRQGQRRPSRASTRGSCQMLQKVVRGITMISDAWKIRQIREECVKSPGNLSCCWGSWSGRPLERLMALAQIALGYAPLRAESSWKMRGSAKCW